MCVMRDYFIGHTIEATFNNMYITAYAQDFPRECQNYAMSKYISVPIDRLGDCATPHAACYGDSLQEFVRFGSNAEN